MVLKIGFPFLAFQFFLIASYAGLLYHVNKFILILTQDLKILFKSKMAWKMNKEEFEELVVKILESVPEEFQKKVENLTIVIDESNIPASKSGRDNTGDSITLALYHGVPITKRSSGKPVFPDKITIYKKAIESISASRIEIEKTTRRVVLHELGHYFGLDEDKLNILGY